MCLCRTCMIFLFGSMGRQRERHHFLRHVIFLQLSRHECEIRVRTRGYTNIAFLMRMRMSKKVKSRQVRHAYTHTYIPGKCLKGGKMMQCMSSEKSAARNSLSLNVGKWWICSEWTDASAMRACNFQVGFFFLDVCAGSIFM